MCGPGVGPDGHSPGPVLSPPSSALASKGMGRRHGHDSSLPGQIREAMRGRPQPDNMVLPHTPTPISALKAPG